MLIMPKRIELTFGEMIGSSKLTYLEDAKTRGRRRYVNVRCHCGNKLEVRLYSVISGNTKSCCGNKSRGGLTRTLTGNSWINMNARCLSPSHKDFDKYSQLGIDQRYHKDNPNGLQNLIDDIGERPSKEYTLDRIDGTIGYFQGNLRWATKSEQLENRSNTLKFEYNGEMLTTTDICKLSEYKLTPRIVRKRIVLCGWTVERTINTPVREKKSSGKKEEDRNFYVYIVECSDWVKIGRTNRISTRLWELEKQFNCKITTIKLIKFSTFKEMKEYESELQKKYEDYQLKHENGHKELFCKSIAKDFID